MSKTPAPHTDHDLLAEARRLLPEMTAWRRSLHRHPEVGLACPQSQATICDALRDLPLQVTLGRSTTSVTAVLEGAQPGPTVLLRADMDALPLQEESGAPFASEVPGVMHACGHDGHVAMLLGAAHLLAGRMADLRGRVILAFQPGEEGHHGARHMLDEGLLRAAGPSAPPPSLAFALHLTPQLPTGTAATRPGALLASDDSFEVTIGGSGGHASQPHLSRDPIPALAELCVALQSLVARRLDPFEPAVLTVARLAAGTADNVIPDRALLAGTLRTLAARTRADLLEALRTMAEGVAAAHGLDADVQVREGYPVTVNDPGAAERITVLAESVLGPDDVLTLTEPVMGAEDFSYILAEVPGVMVFLGAAPPGQDAVAPTHSARFRFDEAALPLGAALHVAVALEHGRGRWR